MTFHYEISENKLSGGAEKVCRYCELHRGRRDRERRDARRGGAAFDCRPLRAGGVCGKLLGFGPRRHGRRDFRREHGVPLHRVDAVPRHSQYPRQKSPAGVGSCDDLHPDCGLLHAVLPGDPKRLGGHYALLRRVGNRHCGRVAAEDSFKAQRLDQLPLVPRHGVARGARDGSLDFCAPRRRPVASGAGGRRVFRGRHFLHLGEAALRARRVARVRLLGHGAAVLLGASLCDSGSDRGLNDGGCEVF